MRTKKILDFMFLSLIGISYVIVVGMFLLLVGVAIGVGSGWLPHTHSVENGSLEGKGL